MQDGSPQFELAAALAAAPTAAPAFPNLLDRVNSLCDENELLGRELLRCYDQLDLVFQITDHIASLDDPTTIEEALLQRWGAMLGVPAIYIDDASRCYRLTVPSTEGAAAELDPERVRQWLVTDIRCTRERLRTSAPGNLPADAAEHAGAHVILAALPRHDEPARVAIAVRPADRPPFDSRDVMASEAALGYGGHVLSNLLMVRQLQHTAFETVRALAAAIDAKDPYTCGHSERVGYLGRLVGEALGATAGQLQVLEWGGLLHDVGKIGIPGHILNKPGKLTRDEYEIIKRHPRLSHDVLSPVKALRPILPAVLHHHENHDGSGYPDGLAGADIPIEARIIHVVDIFDALTSDRSYRARFSLEEALNIIAEGAGRASDPDLTELFLRVVRDHFTAGTPEFTERFAHVRSTSPTPLGVHTIGLSAPLPTPET